MSNPPTSSFQRPGSRARLPVVGDDVTIATNLASAETVPLPSNPSPAASAGQLQQDPERVGSYRIQKRLGQGGMGTVYAAEDSAGNTVALKLLRAVVAEEPSFAERFAREAQVASSVQHENVVRLLDHGTADGQPFMVFELLPGGDLDELIKRRGSLTHAKALRVTAEAAHGLTAIHEAGLVHRDIKPANIFLDERDHVRVGDLGLARHADGEDRMTMTGVAIGTPAYMPPEQLRGEADLDHRADIYSLGASLYCMVTGQDPFVGDTMYVVTSQVLKESMPDPRRVDPSVSPEIAGIIAKAAAKAPAERYQTCDEMLQDIEAALHARPLLHAAVSRQLPKQVAEFKTKRFAKRAAEAAAGAQLASSGGLRLPTGSGRIIAIILLVVVFGALMSLMPDLSSGSSATAGSDPRPAWAGTVSEDQYGTAATLVTGAGPIRLRWIPAGSFVMGSPPTEAHRQAHETQHQVDISRGFWMLENEVTQGVYAAVTGQVVQSYFGGFQRPVDSMTWVEAEQFCRTLSETYGLIARLPSEAEWEYACRAGMDIPFSTVRLSPDEIGHFAPAAMREPWDSTGDPELIHQQVSEALEQLRREVEVGPRLSGSYDANPWGLFDMHGNLSEWCQDRWDGKSDYRGALAVDPVATEGGGRILRGGSWYDPPRFGRAAARDMAAADYSDNTIGFRFVIQDE